MKPDLKKLQNKTQQQQQKEGGVGEEIQPHTLQGVGEVQVRAYIYNIIFLPYSVGCSQCQPEHLFDQGRSYQVIKRLELEITGGKMGVAHPQLVAARHCLSQLIWVFHSAPFLVSQHSSQPCASHAPSPPTSPATLQTPPGPPGPGHYCRGKTPRSQERLEEWLKSQSGK